MVLLLFQLPKNDRLPWKRLRSLLVNLSNSINVMVQQFDALQYELNHAADFAKSRSIQLQISSYHNYSEGITYFTLSGNGLDLGEYYRDPWGDGWYWKSNISGEQAHCDDRAIALTQIQLAYLRWLR